MDDHNSKLSMISILLVEDEADTRDILGSVISKKYPYSPLQVAKNGAEGLDLFMRCRPNIVITDISMPMMNGISMAADIKACSAETVIIAVTAFSDTRYLLDAIEIGINHYVLKPLDYKKLFSIIDKNIATIEMERQVKVAEHEIESLNARLAKRAEELQAANQELEAFNYTISHDLRSPITAILGFSQVLLERSAGPLDEQSKSCVQVIHQETRRMDEMIKSLLKFSRLANQPLDQEQVNLSSIAATIIMELKLRHPERQISTKIGEEIFGIGDPILLRAVMENLIGNAWKYTVNREIANIEFGVTDKLGLVTYYVCDNGIGFESSLAHKVFGVFQRLHNDNDFDGYGIGLATVQRIIQRHGGTIYAEGEAGKGAIFYFTLGEHGA
ncbi:MAG TPA: response regulator [Desulfuromonadaceae bacterium]|jgi:hypothetical protein